MSEAIILSEYKVQDFVSIDHGSSEVTLVVFKGHARPGDRAWTNVIGMSPDQADEIADELKHQAQLVRDGQP